MLNVVVHTGTTKLYWVNFVRQRMKLTMELGRSVLLTVVLTFLHRWLLSRKWLRSNWA